MNELFKECEQVLKQYDLSEEQICLLSEQLNNVCNELYANQEFDSSKEIINELFRANEIKPKLRVTDNKQVIHYINKKDKSAYKKFECEVCTHLIITNKWGGLELDLRNFNFEMGDLNLEITNMYGGITVYVNPDTEVSQLMKNTFAGIETINYVEPSHPLYKIRVTGTNKMAGIEFVSTTEIEHLRKYYNKAAYKANKREEKLNKKVGKRNE